MAPIIHYHFPFSPPSRSVMLVLKYLDIEYEVKEVNILAGENKEDWFLEINPQHAIPVIDDNGFILTESKAILGYLVNSRMPGSSLYPSSPRKRALIDSRLYFDSGTLFTRMRSAFNEVLSGAAIIDEKYVNVIKEAVGWINDFLKESKWLAGDDLTIADLAILATVTSNFFMGIKFEDYPEIERWYEQCRELPGFDENEEGAKGIAEIINSKVESEFAFE